MDEFEASRNGRHKNTTLIVVAIVALVVIGSVGYFAANTSYFSLRPGKGGSRSQTAAAPSSGTTALTKLEEISLPGGMKSYAFAAHGQGVTLLGQKPDGSLHTLEVDGQANRSWTPVAGTLISPFAVAYVGGKLFAYGANDHGKIVYGPVGARKGALPWQATEQPVGKFLSAVPLADQRIAVTTDGPGERTFVALHGGEKLGPWQAVTGAFVSGFSASRIGTTDVLFARGVVETLSAIAFENGKWSPPWPVGGNIAGAPHATYDAASKCGIAAAQGSAERFELVYRCEKHGAWEKASVPSNGGTAPFLMTLGNGSFAMFAVNDAQKMLRVADFDALSGAFHGWQDVGAATGILGGFSTAGTSWIATRQDGGEGRAYKVGAAPARNSSSESK